MENNYYVRPDLVTEQKVENKEENSKQKVLRTVSTKAKGISFPKPIITILSSEYYIG